MNSIFIQLSFLNTSLLVGIIFVFTGIAKVIEPWKFLQHISKLKLLQSSSSLLFAAFTFTAIESALGVALILGVFPSIIIPASILLFIGLMILTYWSTSSGLTEDCGCYNCWVDVSPTQSLILDIVYIVLLAFALIKGNYQPTVLWEWVMVLATFVSSGTLTFASFEYFEKNGSPYIDLSPLQTNRTWQPKWLGEDKDSKLMSGNNIVIFLSTECPQCKKWLNVLKLVHYRDDLPEVVGVVDINTVNERQEFVESYGLNYPVIGVDAKQYEKLQIISVPTAFLLKDGVIKEKWIGQIPQHFARRIREGDMSYYAMSNS